MKLILRRVVSHFAFLAAGCCGVMVGHAQEPSTPAPVAPAAAVDAAAVVDALDQLNAWLGTGPNGDRWRSYIEADQLRAELGKSGDVAVVAHDQTSRTGVDRRDGFVERMKVAYPNVKIVSIQYGGGDHLKSTEIAKSILQAHPNIKGIFGTNEGSAIGVTNGVKEMKRKVVIVGYDSGKQQKDAIKEGLIAGAITQNPVGIGYRTVEAAVKALKGEKLPKVIDTGFYWYDKTNINDPKIAAVLYD